MGTEFIAELNRELTGRMLDIWRGHDDSLAPLDMGAEAQDRYRNFWRSEALGAHPPNQISQAVPRPQDVCRHLVEPPLHRSDCGSCPARWVYPCEVFGRCSPAGYHAGVKRCDGCEHRTPIDAEKPEPSVRRLVLVNEGGPAGALVLSAAIESLHRAHPGRFVTAVLGAGGELLAHNSNVVAAEEVIDRRPVTWEYLVAPCLRSERTADNLYLMEMRCAFLAEALGVPVPFRVTRPSLALAPDERVRLARIDDFAAGRRYWVVGTESGSAPEGWGASDYQRLIDLLSDKGPLVQIGEGSAADVGPAPRGTLDLRTRLGLRELARVVAHAAGGVVGGSLLLLLCATFETPHVCIGQSPVDQTATRGGILGHVGPFEASDAGEWVTSKKAVSPELVVDKLLRGLSQV